MTPMASHQENHGAAKQEEPVDSLKQNGGQVLSKNRLVIVTFALMCTMFLGALDGVMIATMLPTIVAQLHGGNNYSWIGNSYLLAAGAFGPLYGKLSNMFGQKTLLYTCIFVFLIGSLLCGAAQTITWLIVCRAIQGIGGGGIVQLSMIIISDIVPLKDRGRYVGLLGTSYGIANVSGPLLGGALTHRVSWRWCFFIQLPIGVIAAALLIVFLNVPNHSGPGSKRPLRDQIAELDFIGVFSLVTGVTSLLLGLSFGDDGWSEPRTISLLVMGVVLLVCGGFNEAFTNRAAILPPRLFKTRTTACILAITFLNNVVILLVTFYLPLFYQVLGSSPVGAGVKLLPYALAFPVANLISGFIVSKTGRCRPVIWFGGALVTLGTSLLFMLDYTSSIIEQEISPMITSIGEGFLFQTVLVALQAAMPREDMAAATSGLLFLRPLGGVVGLAVGEAILAFVLPRKLATIPNIASLGLGGNIKELNENVSQVHLIPNVTLRNAVLHAWSRSIAMIWMLSAAVAGVMLILSLFLREYPMDRPTTRSEDAKVAEDEKRVDG